MKHQNQLAVKLLQRLVNSKPTEKHIKLIEQLLLIKNASFKQKQCNRLTEKEINFIYWAAKGLTNKEIASITRVSLKEIECLQASVKTNLKCKTIPQAVYEAIHLGYLMPNASCRSFHIIADQMVTL